MVLEGNGAPKLGARAEAATRAPGLTAGWDPATPSSSALFLAQSGATLFFGRLRHAESLPRIYNRKLGPGRIRKWLRTHDASTTIRKRLLVQQQGDRGGGYSGGGWRSGRIIRAAALFRRRWVVGAAVADLSGSW